MSAPAEAPAGGLTALDWVVITAATVSLVVIVLWLVQDRKKSNPPEAGS